MQVDFANQYIGGGVLGCGCVQEEIRFAVEPELLPSMTMLEAMEGLFFLFTIFSGFALMTITSKMSVLRTAHESIAIWGSSRVSNYSGYAFSLQFNGDFRQPSHQVFNLLSHSISIAAVISLDLCELLGKSLVCLSVYFQAPTALACVDAVDYRGMSNTDSQFATQVFTRELNKAYCSFARADPLAEMTEDALRAHLDPAVHPTAHPAHLPRPDDLVAERTAAAAAGQPLPTRRPVATGHWGCGAFKGDRCFKALLQWCAASAAGRDTIYYSFGETRGDFDPALLARIVSETQRRGWSVRRLLQCVNGYQEHRRLARLTSQPILSAFQFVWHQMQQDGMDVVVDPAEHKE